MKINRTLKKNTTLSIHNFSTSFIRRIAHAFLCFILCAAFASAAFAQQSLTANDDAADFTGRVEDAAKAGIGGALVTLYSRAHSDIKLSTIADEDGSFRFENLASGDYVVEAEAAGFARSTAQSVRVSSKIARGTFDIVLAIAGVSEEVSVTASSTPQTIDETSKAISIITRREIETRDEFTVADALRTVPGLRVQQLGSYGRLTSIRTRGLRNQDTAILVDGLRFRDASTINGDALSFISDFVITNPSRIEVLRGSGSSLYGTNSIGGTINILTDEGGGKTRGQVFSEGGNLGFYRGAANIAGGFGLADRFIYSAGLTHLNVARGVDGDDATRNTSGQGRLLFRITPSATVSARIYTGDAFVQLNSSPQFIGTPPAERGIINAVALSAEELRRYENGARASDLNLNGANFIPDANDSDSDQRTRFLSAAFQFAQRPTENFGYTVSYQTLSTRRANRNGSAGAGKEDFLQPFGGETRERFAGAIHTLNARADFRVGGNNFITAGYEFENENFVNDSFPVNPANDSSTRVTQRSNTFFAQDQLRFLDERLQLSAAFRVQSFALRQPQFTPIENAPYRGLIFTAPPNAYTGDASIAYLFRSTDTKFRAHVGNGYRAPSLYERFGTFYSEFSGGFVALGEPQLKPERSIAVDGGVDQSLANNRVRLSATYFYTRLQEIINFTNVAAPVGATARPFGAYFNTGGGLARGAELSATIAPTNTLDVFASYTYTNSDNRNELAENTLRSFVVPVHQFTSVVTHRIGRRFLVNFDLQAASDYLAPFFYFDTTTFQSRTLALRFNGIVKADLGASYTLPLSEERSVRFFGKVDNLTDRDNYESGFRTPGRAARAGAAFRF